jgi:hypothetical protein
MRWILVAALLVVGCAKPSAPEGSEGQWEQFSGDTPSDTARAECIEIHGLPPIPPPPVSGQSQAVIMATESNYRDRVMDWRVRFHSCMFQEGWVWREGPRPGDVDD